MTETSPYDLEVCRRLQEFRLLPGGEGVSFDIPSGSFFSILGPSGCGKTTLMRMIAGFEEPSGGDIRIKGKSVLGVPPNRRNVKMVFQHLALFPMMNVYENIAYGLSCNGVGKAEIERKVQDVLERIALPDVGEREIHQLSGGQKQRIAIARCMVLDPDVLLLDEPLGALDLKLREAMKIELKLLQHQFNTTFVYITHDQSEALVMSDNVAIMNQGEVRADRHAAGSSITTRRPPFVAGFVGDSNRWSGTVKASDGTGGKVETEQGLPMSFSAAGGQPSGDGSQVDIFVRPEFIRTVRSGAARSIASDGDNRMDGVVDSLLFNGANSRVLVRTGSGELVEADVILTGDNDLKPGEDVSLVWSVEAGHVLCPNRGQA